MNCADATPQEAIKTTRPISLLKVCPGNCTSTHSASSQTNTENCYRRQLRDDKLILRESSAENTSEQARMEKVIEVLNRMQADGVIEKYAIGGGIAAIRYLPSYLTDDIDV